MDQLRQDIRYACRMLRDAPAFAAVAIAMIALGIGANTAIFSLLDTLMLRPLPVREPSGLVQLVSRYPGEPDSNTFVWRFYEYFRDQNHVFSDLVGVSPSRFQLTGGSAPADPVDGEYVTGDFFRVLGVDAAAGRLIAPEDDVLGSARAAAAVLSWPFWNSAFHLDPGAIGRTIDVNGVTATIVGVAPRGFFGVQLGASPALWVPAAIEPLVQRPSRRTGTQVLAQGFPVGLIARLKPGVTLEQARAEMRVLDRFRVEKIAEVSGNAEWRKATIGVESAAGGISTLRQYYGRPLVALMTVVTVLLVIMCTNVASLLLARGAARRREIAVRMALGAGRLRLVRQMLTESVLLSSAGGVLGVFMALAGARALVGVITSGRRVVGLPAQLRVDVAIDTRVLLFAVAAALGTGLLFGVVPAWIACASAPAVSLRDSGGAVETPSRRRLGRMLIVSQVALSTVLLSAAGVFIGHLSNLRNAGLGFERGSVLLVSLNPQGSGYDRAQLTQKYQELLARFEAIPGVRSATVSAVTPIEGPGAARLGRVEGADEKPEDRRYLSLNTIGPRYFETLGTPFIAGRDFTFDDANRQRVAIVNQAFVRHYFGSSSAIGRHVTFDGEDAPYEIVGVAGDAKYLDLHNAPPRMVYMNTFQEGRITSQFSLRTTVPPTAVAGAVRAAVNDVLRTVRVAKVTTLDEQVDASIVPERLVSALSSLFGGLGAALAAIGIYGLLAYSVARRFSEIGIRMALGASEGDVLRMVLGSALGLVCAGVAAGAPLAWWAKRLATSLVADLAGAAVLPIAAAVVVMIVVALAAAYLPARRAARIQPIDALRHT